MKISIITVTLNSDAYLEQTIDSFDLQDYHEKEEIVKDGGSSDNTREILEGSAHSQRIIASSPDDGIYDALNQGMLISTGDVIGILHADDFYPSSNVLSRVIKCFQKEDCDAVYGDLNYVDRNNPEKIIRNWKSEEYKEGDFLKGWMPPHPAFFVKRSVIEKYGDYNLSLKSAADYEWMLRLIHMHKINLHYLPEVLVHMRVGGQSNRSLSNRIKANLEDRKAWKMNSLKPKWYTLFLKPLKKIGQYL